MSESLAANIMKKLRYRHWYEFLKIISPVQRNYPGNYPSPIYQNYWTIGNCIQNQKQIIRLVDDILYV